MKNDKYEVSFWDEVKIVFTANNRYAKILAQAERIREGKSCEVIKVKKLAD